jgi:hypothetical protein
MIPGPSAAHQPGNEGIGLRPYGAISEGERLFN